VEKVTTIFKFIIQIMTLQTRVKLPGGDILVCAHSVLSGSLLTDAVRVRVNTGSLVLSVIRVCLGVEWGVTLNCLFGYKKVLLVELLYVEIRSATQFPTFSHVLLTSTVLCIGVYTRYYHNMYIFQCT
jgi:hypothetical protein